MWPVCGRHITRYNRECHRGARGRKHLWDMGRCVRSHKCHGQQNICDTLGGGRYTWQRLRGGHTSLYSTTIRKTGKSRTIGLPYSEEKCFDTIPERDRQTVTDRQTDGQTELVSISRVCVAVLTRDTKFVKFSLGCYLKLFLAGNNFKK